MTDVTTELIARVARLEVAARRRGRLRAAVGLGVGAVLLMGQAMSSPAPKTLEVERLVLRDGTGVGRVELSVLPDGSPTLGFIDRDGTPRALLGLGPDGSPGLAFLDRFEKARLTLSLGAGGASAVTLSDKTGRARAKLDVATDGVPGLAFMDRDGRAQAVLGIMADSRIFLFPGGR